MFDLNPLARRPFTGRPVNVAPVAQLDGRGACGLEIRGVGSERLSQLIDRAVEELCSAVRGANESQRGLGMGGWGEYSRAFSARTSAASSSVWASSSFSRSSMTSMSSSGSCRESDSDTGGALCLSSLSDARKITGQIRTGVNRASSEAHQVLGTEERVKKSLVGSVDECALLRTNLLLFLFRANQQPIPRRGATQLTSLRPAMRSGWVIAMRSLQTRLSCCSLTSHPFRGTVPMSRSIIL